MPLASLQAPRKPTLATRQGIAWGLDAPAEDSSVLVTGTPSGHYIDIRFALEGPSTEGPFWAFAGTATYTPIPGESTSAGVSPGWSKGIRGEWAHPIDSMGFVDSTDKADVFDLPNGDQVEFGLLDHPDTGIPTLFKEYWTLPESAETRSPCVRAVFADAAGQGMDGVIIRVGDWAQAIRQTGKTAVQVGRWRRSEGAWVRDDKSSEGVDDVFPVEWIVGDRREGEQLDFGGRAWKIEEIA